MVGAVGAQVLFVSRVRRIPLTRLTERKTITAVLRVVRSVSPLPLGIGACFLTWATTMARSTAGRAHLVPSVVVVL